MTLDQFFLWFGYFIIICGVIVGVIVIRFVFKVLGGIKKIWKKAIDD